ncbi:MAG: sulfatase-like hydrolase/transferase, partial [Planctomycetales bacterium]
MKQPFRASTLPQPSRMPRVPRPGFVGSRVLLRWMGAMGAIVFLGSISSALAEGPPNFVFILADDQGWNALSTRMDPDQPGSGSTYYQTPRLAELAAEGMRFSQAYSPAPTCSPSRHSIQFGRSPAGLKIFGADGIRNWDAENHESLPNVLKSIHPQYVCAHLGKWHIGRSPSQLGYDVSDGNTGNGTGNSQDPDDPKLIFDLSKRA